ncbi:hypothetical protein [Salinispira pacifica]
MERRENVTQLLKDLEYIKAAVKRNHPVFQEWATSMPTRLMMSYFGTATIVVALIFQICISQYGSFAAIPGTVKLLLFAFLGVVLLSATFLKWATLNRSARRIDRKLRAWPLVWEAYINRARTEPHFLHRR